MPAEARAAEREIESPGRVRTEIQDGYAALKAFLPPEERRGLVLIDPPYESLDELKMMLQAFADAYRRWPSGVFLMWYPIRSATQRSMVHARFEALQIPKMLFADLAIHPDDAGLGLAGSGLMIVNPPYGADNFLATPTPRFTRRSPLPAQATSKWPASRPSEWHNRAGFFRGRAYGPRIIARAARQAACRTGRARINRIRRRGNRSAKSCRTSNAWSRAGRHGRRCRPTRSLPDRLERVAVQFEAEHPTLAASARQPHRSARARWVSEEPDTQP